MGSLAAARLPRMAVRPHRRASASDRVGGG
jgi:hypothetical protein